jgi:hypothetical protein
MPEGALTLDPQVRDLMVEKKVTCPFLGSVVHQELLGVRGAADNPLANIEEVRRLGNQGGGDLGDLLAFFAAGNHALMRNSSGSALDTPVPAGLFSLELPGSQGSHPGHSGILMGDPTILGSGRFSPEEFDRLAKLATNGFLKRSDVGNFIAQNLKRDPKAKVASANVAELIGRDLAGVAAAIATTLTSKIPGSTANADGHSLLEQRLTKLMGENNLVGSSGEFGLLFAFLTHDPNTRDIDGEPALSLDRVQGMFVQKQLPQGWQTWKKSRVDWVVHTTALLLAAGKEYHQLSAK